MIYVTRLDNTKLVLNSELIEFVESIPETIISLTTGKKIMVKETIEDIVEEVVEFKRKASTLVIKNNEEGIDSNA